MSVTDGHRTIADFKLTGVTAVPGIGISRLQFSLQAQIAALHEEPARVREPRVFVFAGPNSSDLRLLGTAVPQSQWFAETQKHPESTYFMVFLDLSAEQLSALERMRAGHPMFFRLELHTLVESRRWGWQRAQVQAQIEVPVSAWAKLLKDLGYTEILLVALELPVSNVPVSLSTAVQQLREAHSDFIAARYDRCVGACRLAIEAVDATLGNAGQVDQAFKAFDSNRRQMSRRQRALLVSGAVRHYTHLGHHLNSQAQMEVFSRSDAQFILAATSAVIWDAVSELRQR
jgi:hypothetical protein